MKERKNMFLLCGAVLSAVPLISNMVKSLKYIDYYISVRPQLSAGDLLSSMTTDLLFQVIVNAVLLVLMAILVVVQIRQNLRERNNRTLPIIGIIASTLYLIYAIFSVVADMPSAIIHQALDLLFVRHFINALVINFGIGILGAVFLLIGYKKSLYKRNT